MDAPPSAFDFVPVDVTITGGQLLTRLDLERVFVSVQSGPPLRLHLLHQVILA